MRTLTLAAMSCTVLGLAAGCVSQKQYEALEKAYNQQRVHAQSIQATNDRLSASNEGLVLQKDALETLLKKREAEMEMTIAQLKAKDEYWGTQLTAQKGQLQSEWQKKMAALASQQGSGMEYNDKDNKLTLEAGVFFKSGSDDLMGAARRTIGQVCQALKDTNTHIHIVGHTDNVPVKKALKEFPRGNWQLSAERALSVLLEMSKAGSIDESRLSFEGRGQTSPVADNTTESGRAKNRRVEIYIREN